MPSFNDALTVIATIAAVIAAIYAVIAYHRPKGAAVAADPSVSAPPKPMIARRSLVPIIAAVIAWGAIAFDFADRHWLSTPAPDELELSPDNARIDLEPIPVWRLDKKQFFVNLRQINNGKNVALGFVHTSSTATGSSRMDPDLIDAVFMVLRSRFKASVVPRNEYQVGESDLFFSVPDTIDGIQFDDSSFAAAQNRHLAIYIFAMVRYTDKTLPSGKFIYTEKCIYIVGQENHLCDTGHNRSYIAN